MSAQTTLLSPPAPTVHLTNTITAAIGHMRNSPDFEWDHRIGELILAVITDHYGCSCGYGSQPTTDTNLPEDSNS